VPFKGTSFFPPHNAMKGQLEMDKPLLDASGLSCGMPDGRRLFDELSFQLHDGQILLITGPNGSGKSTLLAQLLQGLEQGSAGTGVLKSFVETEQIAYIPQLQSLEFHLPLTLEEVLEIHLDRKVTTEEATRFGLLNPAHLHRTWNTASGGERQRTLLTCALMGYPRLLILDEPFNHLDQESQTKMLTAITEFVKDDVMRPRAAILVSHLGVSELEQAGVPVIRIELGTRGKG